MKAPKSLLALSFCFLFLTYMGMGWYPKWKQARTEATLSWDVSGYYLYLPAIFIYQDIKQCGFKDYVLDTYYPTPDFQQAFKHESGNYVMKYSCGQALVFLPAFSVAHLYAQNDPIYKADGFSTPYQLAININSLLVAFLGLLVLRRVLLYYFSDGVTALVLLVLVVGTNYLDYSAINGAMTHNSLFTIYALLLYTTIHFYRRPTWGGALAIGLLVGWAALIRPTELLSCLIPVLWGLSGFTRQAIRERLAFFQKNRQKLLLAVLACGAVGFIQLIYWKYATGDWIVYSYEEQGFSWLRPHIHGGLISTRAGWLVYTPMMGLALIGFYPLYRQHRQVWTACLVFSLLFIYVTIAWDIWWYGGSLGQRAMVQAYPVLSFPLAAFFVWVGRARARWVKIAVGVIVLAFAYHNIWLTLNAHRGGVLSLGYMTDAYFLRVFWKYREQPFDRKLLDTDEDFKGERRGIESLYFNDFESDTSTAGCALEPIQGDRSLCLNGARQRSRPYRTPFDGAGKKWVRAAADFRIREKEWSTWEMTQFIIRFYRKDEVVKERLIRVHRFLDHGQTRQLYIDSKCPRAPFTHVAVAFYNSGSNKEILIDNLTIEAFN